MRLSSDTLYSVAALVMFLAGGVLILSFTRQTAPLQLVYSQLVRYAGWTALLIPFVFFSAGLMMTRLKWRISRPNVLVGGVLVLAALAGLTRSGQLGKELWESVAVLITGPGAGLVFIGVAGVGFILLTETPLDVVILWIVGAVRGVGGIRNFGRRAPEWSGAAPAGKPEAARQPVLKGLVKEVNSEQRRVKSEEKGEERREEKERMPTGAQVVANLPGATASVWRYPSLSLLADSAGGSADRGDVKQNADTIEQTLESFGIKARVAEINYGPAVTQYALEIALGTKLARITTLQNDLALALAAPTGQIRVEAPIPGRNLVGIEVPNRAPEFVSLKTMLNHKSLKQNKSKLAVGLGLNVAGEPVVVDIEEMPHVLIAGATGSGKSVCINDFLCTILFRASPEEVKLILIDPKRVELTGYNGIPHLLTPVIVDPGQVVSALKWAMAEMERRYKVFAEVGAKNMAAYNEQSGFQAMPYIVVVVDELADIMLFASSEVEEAITRLAQMARATGIHLVVSTQRPSTDVITGLIKANIPCRIAFNVTSMVDSRVILDMPGAEKLLGRGDMLFIPPSAAKPTRIQGAFVSDREIDNLIKYLKTAGVAPEYNEAVTEKYQPRHGGAAGTMTDEMGKEVDPLFEEAVKVVTQYDKASASLMQRRLSIGYARAARILDQLHHHGVVGAPEGSKPREVLIKNAEEALLRLKGE
jgi:S-DNA-T family DNA segregation ATPase FtsK/SpoIIIE